MLDVVNSTDSMAESINAEISHVESKVEELKAYRYRLEKMLDVLMPESAPVTLNRSTATKVKPEPRKIIDAALNVIRNRDAVKISWLVSKLEPKLKREHETHRQFYKNVFGSLVSNSRSQNARVRIPATGLVVAK